MNEHKAVPNIRFRNFKDEWTKKKISNFIIKNSDKNKNLVIKNIESISNKTGFTKQSEQFDGYRVASQDISNYYVISPNQFAYNPSRINVGSIAYKKKGEDKSIISPLYISFSTSSHINDSFLWFWFKTTSFKKQRIQFSEGGVRDTLPFENLKKMEISSPLLQEQKKIGNFFAKLDKLLDLQQQKIDKLELLKKAFLQKLFPKHDAQIPEFRFKGCNGEWEDCLVGNLLEVVPNKKYITEASKKGLNPVIQQGEKPILGFSNKAPYKEYKKVVLFGDHTLSLYKPKSPFLIATDGIKILYVKDWNGYFLFAFLQKYKPDSEGYKRHFSILKSKKAKFTVIDEEQQKIGNLLSEVDQLIELENQKLQNFQQVKKCLLQNMFVE